MIALRCSKCYVFSAPIASKHSYSLVCCLGPTLVHPVPTQHILLLHYILYLLLVIFTFLLAVLLPSLHNFTTLLCAMPLACYHVAKHCNLLQAQQSQLPAMEVGYGGQTPCSRCTSHRPRAEDEQHMALICLLPLQKANYCWNGQRGDHLSFCL